MTEFNNLTKLILSSLRMSSNARYRVIDTRCYYDKPMMTLVLDRVEEKLYLGNIAGVSEGGRHLVTLDENLKTYDLGKDLNSDNFVNTSTVNELMDDFPESDMTVTETTRIAFVHKAYIITVLQLLGKLNKDHNTVYSVIVDKRLLRFHDGVLAVCNAKTLDYCFRQNVYALMKDVDKEKLVDRVFIQQKVNSAMSFINGALRH